MMTLRKILAACMVLASFNAYADLQPGAAAPDFTAQATQGGNEFTFALHDALKKGPVVLYCYPAACTQGCTIEAHDFAEAMPQDKALGATVIGVSEDPIAKLKRFSVSECRSKFPVAADADGLIMKAYDAVMPVFYSHASRTSYVISPEGKILYAYTKLSPDEHVRNTLAALKIWRDAQQKAAAGKQ